mgnify:CR=1 FL=1
MERQVQIIYFPGTFGNCLRWLFDRFSDGSKFKQIDSPWDKDDRVHGFRDHMFMDRFQTGHQWAERSGELIEEADKIVLSFQAKDLPFVERCDFYRNPGNEDEKNNPNGALKNIAGIFNKDKNILGMMPHPERMIDPFLSGEDGSLIFENLIGSM